MNPEPNADDNGSKQNRIDPGHLNRLKLAGAILTTAGIILFAYLIYSVGLDELLGGISRFGFFGFAIILIIYFFRMAVRAMAWSLSVYEPYELKFSDTLRAVLIGEAMSSLIPLGILVSGTSKAIAVRRRVPLVVGLSSVATENLFYSLVTSIFLILGSITFVRSFPLDEGWVATIDIVIAGIISILLFLFLMVVRQWHIASEACEWLYQSGFLIGFLEHGRMQVRLFENLIYGFYRRYPKRFLPICGFETIYHILGVAEVWYILSRLSDDMPSLLTSFFLESVSRLVTIVFKLIPLAIGVDEAGARFVGETVALAAGVGLTLTIIRKGRILFWTVVGLLLILKSGFSLREISSIRRG